jgi:hypothetical protein
VRKEGRKGGREGGRKGGREGRREGGRKAGRKEVGLWHLNHGLLPYLLPVPCDRLSTPSRSGQENRALFSLPRSCLE